MSLTWLERRIAGCLVLVLSVPVCGAETPLPSAPQPRIVAAETQNGVAPQAQSGSGTQQATAPAPQTTDQQSSSSQVVGTAAGPAIHPEGIPASRPAGAAIAPAKQRRVRIIAISLGLLVGAAVAIGVVAGASAGSPARP